MARLQIGVATAIAILWILAMARAIVDEGFTPSPYLSPAMLIVAGWLYGRGYKLIRKENGNGSK